MKKIIGVYDAPQVHWVGNGFPVRSLFGYEELGKQVSPFLLLDYAGPAQFAAADRPRGVGHHPHRGFETVTIVYQGEVAHRDSTGQGGVIGPGDVQWMTAGAGILHEEFHSENFSRQGGALEMVQLWVNLPARDKMAQPGYQAIVDAQIPKVALDNDAGSVRVIAGRYKGHKGPARTFTPMDVWDLRLGPRASVELPLVDGRGAAVVVLRGTIQINQSQVVREAQLVLLDAVGDSVQIEANGDAVVLFLSGEAIDEPIVGYGPFVMNTFAEVDQAFDDYRSGGFGQWSH